MIYNGRELDCRETIESLDLTKESTIFYNMFNFQIQLFHIIVQTMGNEVATIYLTPDYLTNINIKTVLDDYLTNIKTILDVKKVLQKYFDYPAEQQMLLYADQEYRNRDLYNRRHHVRTLGDKTQANDGPPLQDEHMISALPYGSGGSIRIELRIDLPIIVKTIGHGQATIYQTSEIITILDLKQVLQKHFPIPSDKQVLIFDGHDQRESRYPNAKTGMQDRNDALNPKPLHNEQIIQDIPVTFRGKSRTPLKCVFPITPADERRGIPADERRWRFRSVELMLFHADTLTVNESVLRFIGSNNLPNINLK